MTSSNENFNNENEPTTAEAIALDCLSYMIDIFEQLESGELQLIGAELDNGQIIICAANLDEPDVLYLPVHLYESASDIDGIYATTYALYPYQNLADEFGEIFLNDDPKIIFCPRSSIKDKYFEYWDRIKNSLISDVNPEENVIQYMDSDTTLKS